MNNRNGQTKRTPMQVTIETILRNHDRLAEFAAVGPDGPDSFHLRIEVGGYMPLVIERHAAFAELVIVTHYYTQNGDSIADPEIVFDMELGWLPVEITTPIMLVLGRQVGGYKRLRWIDNEGRIVTRPHALADVKDFARTWAMNLRRQGFADAPYIATDEEKTGEPVEPEPETGVRVLAFDSSNLGDLWQLLGGGK